MTNPATQSSPSNLTKTTRALLTAATTLLVLVGLGLLVAYFYSMAALLGIVLIVTYILLGPVNLMEKGINGFSALTSRLPGYGDLVRRSPEANPRVLAVTVVYTAFFLGLTIGSIEFIPILNSQLGEMSQKVGVQVIAAADQAIAWADKNIGQGTVRNLFAQNILEAEHQGLLKKHIAKGKPVTAEERQIIQQTVIENTLTQLENFLSSLVPNFISLVGGTVSGFIYFLAGLMLSYYFLADGRRIKEQLLLFFPQKARATTDYLLNSFHQVMFAFIKGQVLLGLLTGGYMFIIYSIFHVPYAFLLGSIFALAELLPVVGTWIGIIVGLTVILLNMPPFTALEVWLCSYLYQTVKDNILAPKVVGDVMGLHPLVIILSLMICAQVAGLLGVLLALPLASAVNVIVRLLLDMDASEKALSKERLLPSEGLSQGDSHAG
jgi:predicted PurR-regulated permease PerM